MKYAIKTLRKVVVLLVGGFILLAGVIMLVTPGPGWVAIFGGLALLSTEFPWAKRWMHQLKEAVKYLFKKMGFKGPDLDQIVEQQMKSKTPSHSQTHELPTKQTEGEYVLSERQKQLDVN